MRPWRLKECFGHFSSRSEAAAHGGERGNVQAIAVTTKLGLVKNLEGQIAMATVGATLLFGCEVRRFSSREEKEYEALWSRVVFGITMQKRTDLQDDKKTLPDLRATCKMKPILDLIQIRQLNYLASFAQLPDYRLEKIVLRRYLVPEHTLGVCKSAPKNTVRNQYRMLMPVSHLAPKSMQDTSLTDWEKLVVDETRWRRFMRKVDKWQDEEEKKRRYSSAHDENIQARELRMTRKAAVDELELEFIDGKAKCPHCQMEYTRSGLAVHSSRCSQLSEAQRAKKTAMRIREAARTKTDLSVDMVVIGKSFSCTRRFTVSSSNRAASSRPNTLCPPSAAVEACSESWPKGRRISAVALMTLSCWRATDATAF